MKRNQPLGCLGIIVGFGIGYGALFLPQQQDRIFTTGLLGMLIGIVVVFFSIVFGGWSE